MCYARLFAIFRMLLKRQLNLQILYQYITLMIVV